MEQIQAEMAEMRTQLTNQMNAQMAQFMEALTNVTRGQQELRNFVENPRQVGNPGGNLGGNQGRLFDDVSGRIDMNHVGNEQEQPALVHYNPFGEHAYNNQGRFPPPPPSHLLGGRGNMNRNYR